MIKLRGITKQRTSWFGMNKMKITDKACGHVFHGFVKRSFSESSKALITTALAGGYGGLRVKKVQTCMEHLGGPHEISRS